MEAILSQKSIAPAMAAFTVGIAVTALFQTPFGLLAPTVALFLFTAGRAGSLLYAVLAVGLIGSLIVAAASESETRDVAATWAGFFVLAISLGALVATRGSASPSANARPVAKTSAAREQAPSYPTMGPSLDEKAAPRNSPVVSITAEDDKATAAQLVAVSFWGGLPFHLRYWRRQDDGRYRWVESRSEPLSEPSGTRGWRAATVEIDDQSSGEAPPTKVASNPPSDDEAVRAAKFVESLLGNAWAFDAAGRPTYLSPLAQTLVAATLGEFQDVVDEGHTFFKRTAHPDDYERISAAWRHSLETGEPFFLDRRIQRASGIHEWNRTGFVPTRNAQGRITGWYGSTIDLDSHRIAQAELREREQELSQLVDMVPVHIRRLTPQGEPIFFNKRLMDFYGLEDVSQLDKAGMSRLASAIQSTVHPDDGDRLLSTARASFASGEPFSLKYRMRRADGAYHWVDTRGEPLRNQNGSIVQWYVISLDVDDEMRARQALEEREARIRRLMDSDIIGIVFWDLDGTLLGANDAFLRMLQYSREELEAGLDWFAMTPPEWQEMHAREEAEELARTGKMLPREKEYFRKDGSRVPILIGAACFENNPRQGIAYILDLTERKRTEAALRERERELHRTQERLAQASQAASLSELSASIAHEVNQPLAAVVANSHACQRWLTADPPNLERAQTTVERIIRDANGAADVVARIRALFKQNVIARSGSSLSALIADAERSVSDLAMRHGVTVDIRIEPDVPPVAVDQVQIQQVLINLMRNGVEAMAASPGNKSLNVRASREGEAVRIEVRDAGPGIEDVEKIFDAFFTTKESGMGMGLAVSRSIVESHGGRLWAEQSKGGGACFIFTLPIEALVSS
jgi:PAS domain S-box-containing protein